VSQDYAESRVPHHNFCTAPCDTTLQKVGVLIPLWNSTTLSTFS